MMEKHRKPKRNFNSKPFWATLMIGVMILVISISSISAFEFDNIKDYDEDTRTATIKNSILGIPFFELDTIAEVKLLSEPIVMVSTGYRKVAELEVNSFKIYTNLINEVKTYDARDLDNELGRDIDYKVWVTNGTKDIEKERIGGCRDNHINGSCSFWEVEKYIEIIEDGNWVEFDNINEKPIGKIRIGLFTNVQSGDLVEWIPEIRGVKIKEWAVFGSEEFVLSNSVKDVNCGASAVIQGVAVNFSATKNITSFNVSVISRYNDESQCYVYNATAGFSCNPPMIANGTYTFATDKCEGFNTTVIANPGDQYIFAGEFNVGGSCQNNTMVYPLERGDLNYSSGWGNQFGGTCDISTILFNVDAIFYQNQTSGEFLVTNSLISPINHLNTTNSSLTFDSSSSIIAPVIDGNLTNATLYVWNPDDSLFGTNTTERTGSVNSTNLSISDLIIADNYNWNVEWCALQSTGTYNCSFAVSNRTFDITSYEINSEVFSASTSEGATERFEINITLFSGKQVSIANLIYNNSLINTTSPGTIINPSGDSYSISKNLEIPEITATQNATFFWNIVLDDGSERNSTEHLQEVIGLSMDNCTTNTNRLFNFTVVDESTQLRFDSAIFNTSGRMNVQLYTLDRLTLVENFSLNQDNSDTFLVCLSSNLTGNVQFSLDLELQYDADEYASEFYNIQNSTISESSLYTNITLYDLVDTKSQEFVIVFKDATFNVVEGALIQVQRKYIDEGLFKTVEIPKTDINGKTVAHLELADAIYTFIVVKGGSILGTFNNVRAICQDIILGNCDINLNEVTSRTSSSDFTELDDLLLTLSYNKTSRTIESIFSIPSSNVKTLKLNATLSDNLGNTEICSDSLTSSSGTLTCNVPITFGNASMIITITSDDELVAEAWLSIAQTNKDIYGASIVFLMIFLYLTLIGVGISDNPMITGFFILLGAIIGIGLNLVSTEAFIGKGATILWLVIIIVMIWIKGAKRA